MKVAVCFWGLCRSTDHTIESIRTNVFDVLSAAGITYDVLVHTFSLKRLYRNRRSNTIPCMLNNELYKLLNPDRYRIEDQDEVDTRLNLPAYRTKGDPWLHQIKSKYETFDNHIRSLYSLYRVTQLWTQGDYDYVLYVRPDVLFLHPLDIRWFNQEYLVLTDFHTFPVNDRFALGTPEKAAVFGERFLNALEFSKTAQLHSETYLDHCLTTARIPILEVPFRFRRVRPMGGVMDNDIKVP